MRFALQHDPRPSLAAHCVSYAARTSQPRRLRGRGKTRQSSETPHRAEPHTLKKLGWLSSAALHSDTASLKLQSAARLERHLIGTLHARPCMAEQSAGAGRVQLAAQWQATQLACSWTLSSVHMRHSLPDCRVRAALDCALGAAHQPDLPAGIVPSPRTACASCGMRPCCCAAGRHRARWRGPARAPCRSRPWRHHTPCAQSGRCRQPSAVPGLQPPAGGAAVAAVAAGRLDHMSGARVDVFNRAARNEFGRGGREEGRQEHKHARKSSGRPSKPSDCSCIVVWCRFGIKEEQCATPVWLPPRQTTCWRAMRCGSPDRHAIERIPPQQTGRPLQPPCHPSWLPSLITPARLPEYSDVITGGNNFSFL